MGNKPSKQMKKAKDGCNLDIKVDISKMTMPQASRLYYREKILPVEEALCLDNVYQPPLADAEFGAPPVLLFLGPFSSGKTTIIRHLLGMDYPGMTIGPEPSNERYSIIMHGKRQLLSAHTLIEDIAFPFREMWRFGNGYLNKTYCAYCPSKILENMIIVDTPGVTSFDQMHTSRDYSYESVIRFWTDRADKIILVFDVFKLDLPEDIKSVMNFIQPYEEKCIVILNKADAVSFSALQRALDSITWSLGRLFKQSDLPVVHIGSFWEKGTTDAKLKGIIAEYEKRLLEQINQMEKDVDLRRLNDIIIRAKLAYIHALISRRLTGRYKEDHLVAKGFQRLLFKHLQTSLYPKLVHEYRIQACDLPHPLAVYKQITDSCYNINKHPVSRRQIEMLQHFLKKEMPCLIQTLPKEMVQNQLPATIAGQQYSNFPMMTDDWCTVKKVTKEHNWKARFRALKPNKGKLSWAQMKLTMDMTGLSNTTLLHIWSLIDTDKDGRINEEQFFLFNWLVQQVLLDRQLPHELPRALLPPHHHHHPDKRCKQRRHRKGPHKKDVSRIKK